MGLDALDTQLPDVGQRDAERRHRCVGIAADFEVRACVGSQLPGERRVGGRIVWKEVRLDAAHGVIAVLRAADATEQILARVEEAKPEVAHQPLEARAGAKVHAAGAHVDRRRADGLNDVRVDVRAVSVGEVADRLQVVLEAVVHRDQRQLDELRLLVDESLEVAQLDASVARHGDAQIESPFALAAPAGGGSRHRSAARR